MGYIKGTAEETKYFFTRNAQDDIVSIYRSSDSVLIGTYEYDLCGKPVSITEATISTGFKNLFAYCENNPIILNDSIGQAAIVIFGVAVGAGSGIIAALAVKYGDDAAELVVKNADEVVESGSNITIVINDDGEFITILESGKGMDLTIQMIEE